MGPTIASMDLFVEPQATKCNHVFCRRCALALLDKKTGRTICPMCKSEVTRRSLTDRVDMQKMVEAFHRVLDVFAATCGERT